MKVLRLGSVLVLCLVSLLAVGGARQAFAAPPDIQVIHTERTFDPTQPLSGLCGFNIRRHDTRIMRFISFVDVNGNPTREIDQFHWDTTYSANGHTLSAVTREIDRAVFHEDGSATVLVAGPSLWTTDRGRGPVWGATGSAVIEVDASGNETVVRESGPSFLNDPSGMCAALAP